MNKIWRALLSLSALAPGVAAAQDVPDDRGRHGDHAREARRVDADRSGWRQGGWRQGRDDRGDAGRDDHAGPRGERPSFHQDASLPATVAAPSYRDRRDDRGDGRDRDGRRDRGDQRNQGYRQDSRDGQGDRDDRRRQWQRSFADRRDAYRDDRRFDARRYGNGGDWNRGWRRDERYDWNGYRSANRGAYRLPRYYAPYGAGYGYRRFGVGVTLSSGLFGSNYWLDDPYEYRLPPADGPYRWVRYYDDALLVDVRSGEVVDAVYGIFD